MEKLIQIPKYFGETFEPSVQLIDERFGDEKVASEAWEYIKDYSPQPGHRFILVIAMGASEWWGNNRNGDAFPEQDLLKNYLNFETKYNPQGQINGGALVFKHHKNKLAENHPWFGTVKKSFYNTKMHRVELLLDILASKGQDLIDRINSGEDLSVSMGVRIPYDTCTICGNKAKTREQYCDHLKYELNKIYPDGRKVAAINGLYDYSVHPKPLNFFDISIVFRPADPTGWMLKKVASHHSHDDEESIGSAELAERKNSTRDKVAYLKKLSKIDKVIKGLPVAEREEDGDVKLIRAYRPTLDKMTENMSPLGNEATEALARYPMNKVLSTLSHAGIILTTPEFVDLVVFKLTGRHVPLSLLRDITAQQGELFEKLAEDEEQLAAFASLPLLLDVEPDLEIRDLIPTEVLKRSVLTSKMHKEASHTDFVRSVLDYHSTGLSDSDGKGMLHPETVTDQHTGKKYTTTRGSIEDAKLWDNLSRFGKAALAAGGLAGLYLYLKGIKSPLTPVVGLTSLILGGKFVLDSLETSKEPGHKTDAGESIPRSTSLMEKRSGLADKLKSIKWRKLNPWHKKSWDQELGDSIGKGLRHGRAAAFYLPVAGTAAMHTYYKDRARKGQLGYYADDLDRKLETGGRWAYNHPYITGASAMLGSNIAINAADALRKAVFRR